MFSTPAKKYVCMTKAFALGKRWYGGIRGNRRLLDLGISSARSELMLSQKFQAGRNPYSVFGISLRAYATKYATSSAQPNERLQPAPPWPYEWMMRLGLVVDLPHRLICPGRIRALHLALHSYRTIFGYYVRVQTFWWLHHTNNRTSSYYLK